MRIEHVALQVAAPLAMADWYVEHLGFIIKRRAEQPVPVCFIADETGQVMLEIYHNPAVTLPDYRSMDPLHLHIALVSADVSADRDRLLAAGAAIAGDLQRLDNGDQVAMLRDPWGVPIQLCRRVNPMV